MKKKKKKKAPKLPEVANVRLRIPASTYAYLEVDLPRLTTLADCFLLADKMKKDEKELRYKCEHNFSEIYKAKSGRRYKECWECGAQSYEEENGTWSLWKFPVKVR